MKLKILDINKFIEQRKIKEVFSTKYYKGSSRTEFNPSGLFSEEIFGRLGSKQRKQTFGYININTNVIHPEAYKILTSLDTDLTKYIIGKQNYDISDDGLLIKNDMGTSGIIDFINNFDKINFDNFDKKTEIKFIKNNKDKLFINKMLVLPAGVRDIIINQTSGKTLVTKSEINELYLKLLRLSNNIPEDSDQLEPDLFEPIIKSIQRSLIEINDYIKQQLKGKTGLIRGGLISKVVDFAGRFVISPDNDLDLGQVKIAWHSLLKLFEPFAVHYIMKNGNNDGGLLLISQYLGLQENPDINDIRLLFKQINTNPKNTPAQLKDYLKKIANEITKDRTIVYKRDPVENRDSYTGATIVVDDTSSVLKINPFDLNKNTGDFDGDACNVYAVLTEEANKQVQEKMVPSNAKNMWILGGTSNRIAFNLEHDAAMQVYAATKK